MTSREQFEQYAGARLGLSVEMIFDARNGDRYLHAFDSMNVMQPLNGWWAIWQDSRAAIELNLTSEWDISSDGSRHYDADSVDEQLLSLGIKVKK